MNASLFDRLQGVPNAAANPFYDPPIDLEAWESNLRSDGFGDGIPFEGMGDEQVPSWLAEARQQEQWTRHIDAPNRNNIGSILDIFVGGPPTAASPARATRAVEAIAWYRAWRYALHAEDWGIFLNVSMFAEFVDDLWTRVAVPGIPWAEFRWWCWRFVWSHEANHYEVDLALAMLSAWTGGALQPMSLRACRHEESLGQSRGLKGLGKGAVNAVAADAITKYFETSSLRGYSDLTTWTQGRGPGIISRLSDEDGLECVLGHRLAGHCGGREAWLRAGRLLRPAKTDRQLGANLVPVHFVLPMTVPPGAFAPLTRVAAVHISSRASKTLKKLSRSDKRLAAAWEETVKTLMTNPTHPSLRLQPFKGMPNVWEVRIDSGNRALLERDASTKEMTVLDIGNDLYDH